MVSVDVDMVVGPAAAGRYTENDVPHPQDDLAFGLLKMNPRLIRLVS